METPQKGTFLVVLSHAGPTHCISDGTGSSSRVLWGYLWVGMDSLWGWGNGLWWGHEGLFGVVGKRWHWRIFNMHVMYDNRAWRIKYTPFTPKSNTRDPRPVDRGSNSLIRMASWLIKTMSFWASCSLNRSQGVICSFPSPPAFLNNRKCVQMCHQGFHDQHFFFIAAQLSWEHGETSAARAGKTITGNISCSADSRQTPQLWGRSWAQPGRVACHSLCFKELAGLWGCCSESREVAVCRSGKYLLLCWWSCQGTLAARNSSELGSLGTGEVVLTQAGGKQHWAQCQEFPRKSWGL